ncbi:MAG: hypothetical protein ACTHNW_14670 [Mucilaginibacter sp.]
MFNSLTKHKLIILVCMLVFYNYNSYSQSGKFSSLTIEKQANIMAQAFIMQDYQTFAKYTYPALLAAMGGENQMAITLRRAVNDMRLKGMSFSNIYVDSPSKIVKSRKELQCTLQQHTTIKLDNGRVVATSTLIALSEDGGKHWYFVDTSNKDNVTIHKILPNLSALITIPSEQKPIFYKY